MEKEKDKFYSLQEAAVYAHVCRQAIYVAIRKGQLRAEKMYMARGNGRNQMQWVIDRHDLDVYRSSKYNREKRMVEGEKLFDIELDRWSVLHAAKTLSSALGYHYKSSRIYYLLRIGKIRGYKKGSAWVISRDTLMEIYHQETGEIHAQLKIV